MHVLLDGIDGCGKSTLAEELRGRYGFGYVKFGIPDEHPMDYWFRQLREVQGPVVIDRMHLSEEAYGPVFRGGSALSQLDLWIVEGWLWARRALVVMCSVPWETAQQNQAKSVGEYHGDKQVEVRKNFDRLLETIMLPCVTYDYTQPQAMEAVTRAVRQRAICGIEDYRTSELGTPEPTFWLVGERPGRHGSGRPIANQVAFFSQSGDYLRRVLQHLGLTWSTLRLSNAYESTGGLIDLMQRWIVFGRPRTVALGTVAGNALTEAGVPHLSVSHPQHRRRFYYHRLEEYVHELRSALFATHV